MATAFPMAGFPGQHGLVVPTNEQFALLRAQAKEDGSLQRLRQAIAAWQAVADKCNLAFEQMLRLAVFRLEVERDLGAQLARTVKPGRRRKSSPASTFADLPDGISRNQSAAYQRLAAIDAEVFRAYLERSRAQRAVPSSTGARRFATPKQASVPQARKHAAKVTSHPTAVLDAISRLMTPDVVVGEAAVESKARVSVGAVNVFDKLRGDVLVADCPDPIDWLPRLLRLRNKARIHQAVVLVAAEPWADWFTIVRESIVSCCFISDQGAAAGRAVLHIGAGDTAFRVAMSNIGVIVRA